MDGSMLHCGAVGAVPGVKNPVKLAQHICKKQSCNALALGRVPPRLVPAFTPALKDYLLSHSYTVEELLQLKIIKYCKYLCKQL
jgi:isoaspartyl peptidase/L-asparaginase-like protein (Ntn-hydrolase superfamily)